MLFRLPLILLVILALSACKIIIDVPQGGLVYSHSGSYSCSAGQICEIDVEDALFDQVFSAQPDDGWIFKGWKRKPRGLCGASIQDCHLSTTLFAGNEPLLAFLKTDEDFYLEPQFERTSGDTGPLYIYPNADDERVLSGIFDDGDSFLLFGKKNEIGDILSIDSMHINREKPDDLMVTFLPNMTGISVTEDGYLITITPLDDGSLLFQISDGVTSFKAVLELPEISGQELATVNILQESSYASAAVGSDDKISAPADTTTQVIYPRRQVDINVIGCTLQDRVYVVIRDENGQYAGESAPAYPDSDGLYHALLKPTNTDARKAAEHLEFAARALEQTSVGNLFDWARKKAGSEYLDFYADYLINNNKPEDAPESYLEFLNRLGNIDKEVARSVKEAVGKALKAVVKTVGHVGLVEDLFYSGLIAKDAYEFLEEAATNKVTLQAFARTSRGKFDGPPSGLMDADGPYTPLSVECPLETALYEGQFFIGGKTTLNSFPFENGTVASCALIMTQEGTIHAGITDEGGYMLLKVNATATPEWTMVAGFEDLYSPDEPPCWSDISSLNPFNQLIRELDNIGGSVSGQVIYSSIPSSGYHFSGFVTEQSLTGTLRYTEYSSDFRSGFSAETQVFLQRVP
jgi:hypothetical protein